MTTWTDPRTWLAGETVTAALMNTHIRDNQLVLSEAWPTYTPTWTGSGFAIGNGTITGSRIIAGKLCLFEIVGTIGSTTTVGTGAYIWSMPAACLASGTNMPVGNLAIYNGSTVRQRNVYANSTTTCAANDEAGTFVSGTAPFNPPPTGTTFKIRGMVQLA